VEIQFFAKILNQLLARGLPGENSLGLGRNGMIVGWTDLNTNTRMVLINSAVSILS